ncbi:MAG: 4Fe-4S dicluster domain-containing protein [Rhodomicrobium sp.]
MAGWLSSFFENHPKRREERRRFLRSSAFAGLTVAASLVGFIPIVLRWHKRLRPPGAIAEHEYLAACIKCGQCVQVCPVQAIRLGDINDGYGLGVPYIAPRVQACDFSCDAVQCILACPTGALAHDLSKKEEVQMGIARLSNPEGCLARKGLGFKGAARGASFPGIHRYKEVDRWKPILIADHPYDLALCDLCVRECPIEGAISLEPIAEDPSGKSRTPVVHRGCTGCGMCEMICPAEPPAITVDVRAAWPGQGVS